jgi:formylmethanofuran dehydrogenase subunit C
MTILTLELKQQPKVLLEAKNISPTYLGQKTALEIAQTELLYGKEKVKAADFFTIKGTIADGKIVMLGDLSKVHCLGFEMRSGVINIYGNVGRNLGQGMLGGEILVQGNAADYLGAEMQGGIICLNGQAGDFVGSCPAYVEQGMNGGIICVQGKAGNSMGRRMRRGLILALGGCESFVGGEMLAGTIIACGETGSWIGGNMRRGTIVVEKETILLPTFSYSCTYRPTFLNLLSNYLEKFKISLPAFIQKGNFRRFLGDHNVLGKGEILIAEA